MTDETVVAVFDTAEHAALAVKQLEVAGVPPSAISQHASPGQATGSTAPTAHVREEGFWASLFGGEPEFEHDTTVYDRSMVSGSTVVTVRAAEPHLTNIVDILERNDPIDLDQHAASYGLGTTAGSGALSGRAVGGPGIAGTATDQTLTSGTAIDRTFIDTTAVSPETRPGHNPDLTQDDEEVIPLSEEQLKVGKRLVNRGTTRVRRFVVVTPVEEAVTLHSEIVSVDRRPVTGDRGVTAPDFSDRIIEVTETDEEAVVEKTARVKEEVVVNKAATDRVETVHDTVRHEDVEISRDGKTMGPSDAKAPVAPTRQADF